jgi:pimeloyl-ACP methyl ester carboxylesterase
LAEPKDGPSPALEHELCARFEQAIADQLGSRPHLIWRGRNLTADCVVQIGTVPFLLRIEGGCIQEHRWGLPLLCSWTFAVRASVQAWDAFWQDPPPPGWHDIFALTKRGEMSLEGNLQPLMANLQYVKDLLSLPRHRSVQASESPRSSGTRTGAIEPIVGRYAKIRIMEDDCRIYFEEAGRGIPLVCLHTAGADSRQFRHLLCDEAITRNFRVIAFDYPWHGKSNPPAGYQDREYRLTTELYSATIRAFCRALGLDRPVVMGCSIGGRIVLQLANAYGAEYRALIGLESADYQQPWYDTSWLHRSDVHGGEVCAALCSGLVGPGSPDEYRHETLWQYMQGGPGVFKGDLHFYRVDADLRGKLDRIDTAACPLYLLTGEYDFSCTPEDTRRTAAAIPGAKVTIMKGMGHFPMSENPSRFREYILPVLAEIQQLETSNRIKGQSE